jgi:hypothetical protein
LEPLQNPPGSQEGRLCEASLQALLRELATFNTGLCVITTRTPVTDLADHERSSDFRSTPREIVRRSPPSFQAVETVTLFGRNSVHVKSFLFRFKEPEADARAGTSDPMLPGVACA